jgi:branched-chain amino acid transport system ATP-binding protein
LIRTFQEAREWGSLTTLENVMVAATPLSRERVSTSFLERHRRASDEQLRARAREILTDFGLLHVRNELAGNLSGGQKRLLEFARIVSAQPKMVLLDEPQAGVNPVLGDRMAAAVESLNASGITILLVEHNLEFVERLCTEVHVMNLGTNLAAGRMADLRNNTEVIDAYLGSVSRA